MTKAELQEYKNLVVENVKLRADVSRLSQVCPGHADGNKIRVIKLVRELTGKPLKDAKDVVDAIWR